MERVVAAPSYGDDGGGDNGGGGSGDGGGSADHGDVIYVDVTVGSASTHRELGDSE